MKTAISSWRMLLLLTATLLVGCGINCPKNYTSTIKKIMNPMKTNLNNFFAQHGRYPDKQERDALLESSGCIITNSTQHKCVYNDLIFSCDSNIGMLYPEPRSKSSQKNYTFKEKEVTPQEPTPTQGQEVYTFAISKENSHCTVDMTSTGEMLEIQCIQDSCIKIDP